MLIKVDVLQRIRDGEVTLAFRRWRRPTVRAGGTLNTAIGILEITDLRRVSLNTVTAAEAKQAGFDTRRALLTELEKRPGDLYRIQLRYGGPDARRKLRQTSNVNSSEMDQIVERLRRFDRRSRCGDWTERTLLLIEARPCERAAELAQELQCDKEVLKRNVRKLKSLGLTSSEMVGYRLSPRGEVVVNHLRSLSASGGFPDIS